VIQGDQTVRLERSMVLGTVAVFTYSDYQPGKDGPLLSADSGRFSREEMTSERTRLENIPSCETSMTNKGYAAAQNRCLMRVYLKMTNSHLQSCAGSVCQVLWLRIRRRNADTVRFTKRRIRR
jgi:hypothetical protein